MPEPLAPAPSTGTLEHWGDARHTVWGAPDDVPVPLVVLDANGIVVTANRCADELLGRGSHGPLRVGAPFMVVLGPNPLPYVRWRDADDDEPFRTAIRVGGRLVRGELSKTRLTGGEGRLLVAVDVRADADVVDAQRRAIADSDAGIFVADRSGRVVVANDALARLVGVAADRIVGSDWQQVALGALDPRAIRDVHADLRDSGRWAGRVPTATARREGPVIELSLVRHTTDVEFGEAADTESTRQSWVSGYAVDATEGRSAERELREQARRDQLTGLVNRAGFLQVLSARFEEAQRNGSELTLLYIDLDNFKSLNDHFGHRYGDRLLEAFSGRLRSSLKSSDVIGRIGGDEFVVLFDPGLAPTVLENVIAKLRRRLLEEYQLDDLAYTCTASFGSAEYPRDASSADELLEFADHAMYQAKSDGRNQHARFDRRSFSDWTDREELMDSIGDALESMEIVPYYQPIVDPETGRIVSAEALARWQVGGDPGQVRPPSDFLPLIDGGPAGVRLGIRMLEQVLVHMRSFAETVGPIPISINVSAAQLRAEDVVARIEQLAVDYGPEIRRLRVELVESAFYDGDAIIADNLARILATGASLSLDDFGTGHSSLRSLCAHDFTEVKIDRAFLVAAVAGQRSDRLVFDSMIDLSRKLGLSVVVEGVETDVQADFVRAHGCRRVQGFLYGRPVPKKEFRTRLAGNLPRRS